MAIGHPAVRTRRVAATNTDIIGHEKYGMLVFRYSRSMTPTSSAEPLKVLART
jgi:hypothetical protein